MKRFLFLMVCLCFVAGTAFSQQRMNPEEMAKRTTEWMKTELKLTADQAAKVEAVNLSMAKERSKMMENAGNGGNRETMRAEMEKLNAKTLEEFGKILSKEQLDEYQKQAAQRGGRPGGGGPR